MQFAYRVRLVDEDGVLVVVFPDVPEVTVDAVGRPAAIASAREALGLALRGYLQSGLPLPEPKAEDGELVAVSIADGLKLAVIMAFREAGLSQSELARRLGKGRAEVHRILDPHHPTSLSLIEEALAVLGKQATVEVAAAA